MLMIIAYHSSFSRKSAICTISMPSSLPDVFSRSLNRSYLANNLIINDADCLLLRKAENEDGECFRNCVRNDREIETYITAMLASGSPIIYSDKLELIVKPLKDNEGIYIYSERQIDGNFICKKIFDKVYLIKGRKGTEQIIIK